jgi:hypothetical protein
MGKKLTAHQRKVKNLKNILKGASQRIKSMEQIENTLSKAGRLATSYLDYSALTSQITEAENYLNSNKRVTSNIDRMIRNIGANTSTSSLQRMVKMKYYKTKQRGHNKVATDAEVSVAEVTRLKKRYDKDPSKTTREEYQIISRYHAAINALSNARAMTSTPQELADLRRAKMNRMQDRDISFGGNSTLINDLAYSSYAEHVGREFVETLQNAMADPQVYEAIEEWYRSSDSDNVKKALDQAQGSNWYENFCEARTAIIETINTIRNNIRLPKETEEQLDAILGEADNLGDYENR